MVRLKLFFLIQLLWTTDCKAFHQRRQRIMTPNNGPTVNTPPSQGNINQSVLFPPKAGNNFAPDNNIEINIPTKGAEMPITPAVSTSNGIATPDISLGKAASPVEVALPSIIRVEFPSSITIYVNITNGGPVNPNVDVPTSIGGGVEIPTVETTVDTLAGDNTDEVSTVSSTVEISTDETTNTDDSIDLTTIDNTIEVSTIGSLPDVSTDVDNIPEVTTTENTNEATTTENITVNSSTADNDIKTPATIISVEIPSVDTTVEVPTTESGIAVPTIEIIVDIPSEISTEIPSADSTADVSTTERGVEVSTVMITVDIPSENITDAENIPSTATTVNVPSSEAMRQIQININLSDNSLNGNFGSTTQSSAENFGQLKDKMIYKQKCDEYHGSSVATKSDKVQVFIVGGTSSMPKEFPHMAALGYGSGPKKEWLCGGSLISENYVVTAAHCLSSKTLGDVQIVRLGTTILDTVTSNSEDYKVIKRITHPSYNTVDQYNDIALLLLDRPVKFSEYISPICLYSSNPTEEILTATGWGKTDPLGDVSPELQKVELEYFQNSECQSSYSVISKEDLPRGIVAETQICAGSRTEVKDTCQGDSGGPLQIENSGRMYLVGITSFGIGCGKPGRPGVYTRVSYYIPWIENIVWGGR